MLGFINRAKNSREILAEKEQGESCNIPFTHHYDEHTICNDDGAMFQIIRLSGIPFETIDADHIIEEKQNRNRVFTSVLDDLTGIHTYTIRREEMATPEGNFEKSDFAGQLNTAYLNKYGQRKAYVNEHYLVVIRKPHTGAQATLKGLAAVFYKPHRAEVESAYKERRDKLGRMTTEIMKRLEDYAPALLTVKQINGHQCSEPLEFLDQLINHVKSPIRLPRMDLKRFLPACRHIFGHETIEIRYPHKTRYAAMISIKEYGTPTDAGMLDQLMELPLEMIITQSFFSIDQGRSLKLLKNAQRLMIQAEDSAISLIAEMEQAEDDLASKNIAIGEHHFSIMVLANTEKELLDHVASIYTELSALGGLKAVREDLNMEGAFWGMLPGNGRLVARGTPITSRNFAGFSSFHNQPSGQRDHNHWGPCVSVMTTQQGTPYFFNFHDHDLGMTTFIGPSGYGKTLTLCFLLAQAQKYKPRMIQLDYERGADIFIRALGGTYTVVTPATKTGWNPLQLDDTLENRAFLANWFEMLLTANSETLSAKERDTIKIAVDGNYKLPRENRVLEHVAPFFGMGQADSLHGRLQQWYGNGQRAYLFDSTDDTLDVSSGIVGFDMTHILRDKQGRNPAFFYLYHRIEQALDGYPTIIPIEESWAFFDNDYFSEHLKEKLKIVRRKNAMFCFATNDVTDAANSSISSTLITQSATNIFFGNIKADYDEYKKFGVTKKEFELIKSFGRKSHLFLLKQGNESVVLRLDLTGLERFIPVLSSNEKNAKKLEAIRARTGDDPANWLPEIMNTIDEKKSCAV